MPNTPIAKLNEHERKMYNWAKEQLQKNTDQLKKWGEREKNNYDMAKKYNGSPITQKYNGDQGEHLDDIRAKVRAYADFVKEEGGKNGPSMSNTMNGLFSRSHYSYMESNNVSFYDDRRHKFKVQDMRVAFEKFKEIGAYDYLVSTDEQKQLYKDDSLKERMKGYILTNTKDFGADSMKQLNELHEQDMDVVTAAACGLVKIPENAKSDEISKMDLTAAAEQGRAIRNLKVQVEKLYEDMKATDSIFSRDSEEYKRMKESLKATRDLLRKAVKEGTEPGEIEAQMKDLTIKAQKYEQVRGPMQVKGMTLQELKDVNRGKQMKPNARRDARRDLGLAITQLPRLNAPGECRNFNNACMEKPEGKFYETEDMKTYIQRSKQALDWQHRNAREQELKNEMNKTV